MNLSTKFVGKGFFIQLFYFFMKLTKSKIIGNIRKCNANIKPCLHSSAIKLLKLRVYVTKCMFMINCCSKILFIS